MKKILTILAIMSFSLPVLAHDFTYQEINYTIIDSQTKTCRTDITTCDNPELIIPATAYNGKIGYTVVEIGDSSFYNFSNTANPNNYTLKSVVLPKTVTRIGKKSFARNLYLQSVEFPEALVEIADSAFYGCTPNLDPYRDPIITDQDYNPNLVEMPTTIKRIGKGAFQLCEGLMMSNIPESLTVIEDYSFAECRFFDNIAVVPETLTHIGKYAFYHSGLYAVDIPPTVDYIGDSAFEGNKFVNITLPSSLSAIGNNSFKSCTNLYSIDIPASVANIGNGAFMNCARLSNVIFPPSLLGIGDRAFYGCDLASVNIPEGVTWIGDEAFYSPDSYTNPNRQLYEMSLPNSLIHIGKYAFSRCMLKSVILPPHLSEISEGLFFGVDNMPSINIPHSVSSIGRYAFSQSGLSELKLPSTVTSIGGSAFEDCVALTTVELGESLDSIGDKTFFGCKSLKTITLPNSLRVIGEGCFAACDNLQSINVDSGNLFFTLVDGMLFDKDLGILLACPAIIDGTYIVPTTVKKISGYSFYGQSHLTAVTFPDGLISIGDCAFYNCAMLVDAKIPASLNYIGKYAFNGCGLRVATIPNGIRNADHTFSYNPELESVWIYGEFDNVSVPFALCPNINKVYYVTQCPQEDIGEYVFCSGNGHEEGSHYVYEPGNIDWGFATHVSDYYNGYPDPPTFYSVINYESATLYVPEQIYDEISNGSLEPWSCFNTIEILDPSETPYNPDAIDEIMGDSEVSSPVAVYDLSGVKIANSTDNLQPGIYIVRQGSKTKKIAI